MDRTKSMGLSRVLGQSSRWLKEPLTIIKYFLLYLLDLIQQGFYIAQQKVTTALGISVIFLFLALAYTSDGSHQVWVRKLESDVIWYGWWVLLGIASSIGLGTGLHTFMLFLGPFIAQATMTAYKCASLDFQTRGPNRCVERSSKLLVLFALVKLQGMLHRSAFWVLPTL